MHQWVFMKCWCSGKWISYSVLQARRRLSAPLDRLHDNTEMKSGKTIWNRKENRQYPLEESIILSNCSSAEGMLKAERKRHQLIIIKFSAIKNVTRWQSSDARRTYSWRSPFRKTHWGSVVSMCLSTRWNHSLAIVSILLSKSYVTSSNGMFYKDKWMKLGSADDTQNRRTSFIPVGFVGSE